MSRFWFSTETQRFLDCCSFSSPSFEGLFEVFSGNRIVLLGNLHFSLNLRHPSTGASSKRYSSLVVVVGGGVVGVVGVVGSREQGVFTKQ